MKSGNPATNYMRGLASIVGLLIIAVIILIVSIIYNLAELLILSTLGIVALIVLPYFLGKKHKAKPGNYSLKKVK